MNKGLFHIDEFESFIKERLAMMQPASQFILFADVGDEVWKLRRLIDGKW